MKDKAQSNIQKGENNYSHKLTNENILTIRKLHKEGVYNYKKLGDIFSVDPSTIAHAIKKQTWSHI